MFLLIIERKKRKKERKKERGILKKEKRYQKNSKKWIKRKIVRNEVKERNMQNGDFVAK